MAVLIFHVTVQNGFLGNFLFSGGHGVDLFFIISGFVMVYAHDGERGLRAAWRFCRRRIIRIYPPYWIVMFGVWWAGLAHIDTSPISAFFLYNQGGPAIIQQAWTLSMEMAFYILFVAFFFVGKRGFAVLSAGWVALVAYNFLYPWYSGLLLTTRVTEFFMGALGAYIVCACRHVRISGVWVLVAGILTGATFYFDSYGRLPHYYDVWNYGATCTLLISAGALWDLSYRPRYPRWVMVLGDASYAIYLLHYVERDALTYVMQHYPVLSRWGQDLPVGVGIATIAFTGVLFHWWIERPTVRWLHARVG